jgi:hypothetical protein
MIAVSDSSRPKSKLIPFGWRGVRAVFAQPACVLADGPHETDGDGGFEYVVCFGDEDGEPITENKKAVWIMWDFDEVVKFSAELARKYGLEQILEAMPA